MARKTKQQALETRGHIIDAAISCFSEQGVSATSLADVAAAAGVTRGAIYWHFKNKTDLLNEIWMQTDSSLDEVELEYQSKFPGDPLSVLRAMLIHLLESTVHDCRRRALMEIIFHKCEFVGEMAVLQHMQQRLLAECYEKIEDVLRQCIDAGQLPSALNTRRTAIIMRSYVTGLMENWLFSPEKFNLAAEAATLIDGFIDMLRLSPSLRLAD